MSEVEDELEKWRSAPAVSTGVAIGSCFFLQAGQSHELAVCAWMLAVCSSFIFAHRLIATSSRVRGILIFVFCSAAGVDCFRTAYTSVGILAPHSERYLYLEPDSNGMCVIGGEESDELVDAKIAKDLKVMADAEEARSNYGNRVRADCLYFSIVTWTTLGYGDMQPTEQARSYAAIEAMSGYVVFGLLLTLLWYSSDQSVRDSIESLGGGKQKKKQRT